MTVAEIHGKISEEGINLSERMEDLLTSDIFGCMRYLPAQKVLIPFLLRARSFYGNALTVPVKVIKVRYLFWPWLKSPGCIPCEPDVVLGLETEGRHVHMVLVEAKYYSGLSSEENESVEPNDQLARELDNLEAASCATLGWRPQLEIASRAVLFVTRDMGMPRELLRQKIEQIEAKIRRIHEGYEAEPPLYTAEEAEGRIGAFRDLITRTEKEQQRLQTLLEQQVVGQRTLELVRRTLEKVRDENLENATFSEKQELIARLGIMVYPSADHKTVRIASRLPIVEDMVSPQIISMASPKL